MVTSTKDETVFGHAVMYFGTAGSVAATGVGYIGADAELAITYTPEATPYRVQGLHMPLLHKVHAADLRITGRFSQFNTDLLELVFGVTAVGNTLTISGSGITTPEFSLKITISAEDGDTITYNIPRAVSVSAPELTFSSANYVELPFEFAAIEDATTDITVTNGYTSSATLATGVLTRTASQGYHTVAGEGDAADTLTSITGTSLTDGEQLVLQIADEDNPITLTHAADTLELTGSVDWVMTQLEDWILLEYDDGDSCWEEKARYDAAV